MIGFDIDGVVREFPLNYNEMEPNDWYSYITNCAVKFMPELFTAGEYVFITATKRTEQMDVDITEKWLERHGIKPKEIYWLDTNRSFSTIIKHKAGIINRLGLSEFYEDDPEIFKRLVRRCPLCKLIYVPSNYGIIRSHV